MQYRLWKSMHPRSWVTVISIVVAAIINFYAHDLTGWTGLGYMLYFGLFPLLAFIVVLIISFFISALSKWEKLVIAIAVAYSFLMIAIALGLKLRALDILLPSGVWLLPLLVWNLFSQWFQRRVDTPP